MGDWLDICPWVASRVGCTMRDAEAEERLRRAGRKMSEFEFPGPADEGRMPDLNNWRSFMEDRGFATCLASRCFLAQNNGVA